MQWAPLMGKVDKIHVYPAFGCGALNLEVYWHYQRVASHFQKLLDTGYMARHSANCENNKRLFADGFESRHLYVMASELLKDFGEVPAGFKEALQQDECVIWKENVLCSKGFNDTEWKATGLAVSSPYKK